MKRSKDDFRKDYDEDIDDGYVEYPPEEDIYSKAKHESEIDPDDISEKKRIPRKGILDEDDYTYDEAGSELDVPGSEFDDELEAIGHEDEENNYYSLSRDSTDDLEDILER
jgi:hypothetical protein